MDCQLLEILLELHPDIDFSSETALIDNKILDSMDVVNLVAEIIDRLEIEIEPEHIIPENFNSYAAIRAMVKRIEDEI